MIILFAGNSFIGRHVAAAAEGRAHVCIVARSQDEAFHRDHAPSAGFVHLEDFAGPAGDDLIGRAGALVHLAGTSIPASNLGAPWLELSDNVQPALQLFSRAAALNPAVRIVLPSSGGTVYGDGHAGPIPETAALQPLTPYALGKVMTEAALAYVARRTGADYAVLRISNPVGRWHAQRGQGLVELAVRRALAGQPLAVFGDGQAVRDYFDADDLADAILTVAAAEGRLQEAFNVGSGQGRTVLQIAELVSSAAGTPLELMRQPARSTDLTYAVLDVRRIADRLGWRASTPLERTVGKLVAAFSGRPRLSRAVER